MFKCNHIKYLIGNEHCLATRWSLIRKLEDDNHEYKYYKKNYNTPTISKTLNAFLNSENGGIITFGISDDLIIHGSYFNNINELDKFKANFFLSSEDFPE